MAQGGKLNAMQVRKLTKPGRYGDGAGLWLQVRTPANRSWLLRYMIAGKARWMGLGDESLVSLAVARQKAVAYRIQLLDGIDPLEARDAKHKGQIADAAKAVTFKTCAERYITAHKAGWRNAKHAAQWEATLATYVYPVVGDLSLAAIDTGHITRILEPIWVAKAETASRVRGRIEAVLNYGGTHGWRSGDNPARWRGHLQNVLPKQSRVVQVEHHAALPWQEIATFMQGLEAENGVAALALRFTILTAGRTGEVLGASWSEIDLQQAIWTVPGNRMKAGREHRVPLSNVALAVLREAAKLGQQKDQPIFPGARKGKPLSNMAMLVLLRRMGRSDLTAHGFRSSFREWAAEATAFPREIAEAALAHSNKDKVEAAYLRSDHFARRRKMMDEWASFCSF